MRKMVLKQKQMATPTLMGRDPHGGFARYLKEWARKLSHHVPVASVTLLSPCGKHWQESCHPSRVVEPQWETLLAEGK